MQLDPKTKKLLLYGLPFVALAAIFAIWKKSSSAASSTATGTIAGTTDTDTGTAPNEAIDVGQLSDFESGITQELAAIQAEAPTGTTSPSPASSSSPSQAPVPTSGSGYSTPTTVIGGAAYSPLTAATFQSVAAAPGGINDVDWEPAPGVFSAVTASPAGLGGLQPGTTLYLKSAIDGTN